MIRKSTESDIQQIHAWLQCEHELSTSGSFLYNWNLTLKEHQDGKLFVFIDKPTNTAVAYQWGDLLYPGVLDVRRDMRCKGIGKKLVEYRIGLLPDHECLLAIQCTPGTSIPFWKKMGFTMRGQEIEGVEAYRILEKMHELPPQSTPEQVKIGFYSEERVWDKSVAPLYVHSLRAGRDNAGIIHLSRRVACHNYMVRNGYDIVVKIDIAGNTVFCDKAKRDEGRFLGLCHCTNGYYIDKICVRQKSK